VKRAALYMRVSSLDQHPETQLLDLRQMAASAATRSCRSIRIGSAAQKQSGRASIR
jgi:DNA invertase Pin-like site-specific DNA recombinase